MSLFLFDAAKLQQQTAKTCQYLIEKQKKVHFFCTFLFLSVFLPITGLLRMLAVYLIDGYRQYIS